MMATIRNLVVRIQANDAAVRPAITRTTKSLTALSKSATKVGRISIVRTAQIGAISALAAGAASATGAVIQLGAALAPAAGLLAALPAAAVMAASALGVLKLATSGVGDAMKAALSGDGKKFEEALKKLSPAARQFAQEFRAISPAFREFQQNAQQGFFSQLTGSLGGFSDLLKRTGPYVRTLAAEMGQWARGLISFVTAEKSIGRIQTILGMTRQSLGDLRGALRPVLDGFLSIAEVGSVFLRGLAPGMANVIARFGQFLSQAAESGRAMEWMETGLAVVKQLGAVLANVGGIVKSIFTAAGQQGGNLLGTFGALTASLNTFLKAPAGKRALAGLFEGLGSLGKALAPVLITAVKAIGFLAPAIGRIATAAGPVLNTIISVLAPALKALEPGITALVRGLGGAVQHLGPALLPLAQAISAIAIALAPVLPALGTLVGKLLTGLANIVMGLVNSGALTQLVNAVILLGSALGDALLEALRAISPHLPELVIAIADLAVALIPLIPAIVELGIAFLPLIPVIADAITLLSELAVVTMPYLLKGMELLAGGVSWLVGAMRAGWSFIASFIRDRIGLIGTLVNGFGEALKAVPGWVAGVFRNAGSWLVNAGKNIMAGLWNGIVSMASWIKRSITNLIKAIIPGPVRRALGIESPSKVMAGLGVHIAEGLAAGMIGAQGLVRGAALGLANAAVPQLATPGVPGIGTPAGVAQSTGSGGRGADDYERFGDAVLRAFQRSGLTVEMDRRVVGEILSEELGRRADQRRRPR